MKRFLLGFIVAVTAMVMMTVGVLADTATVNGITWKYTVSGGKASIYNYQDSAIPKTTTGTITIPSSLGGYPVTSIGNYAFRDCSGLTSVTIPDGVTSIGNYAFYRCDGLTSVTIPDSVTSIGGWAFYFCSLKSVTIGNSVMSIGNYAFYCCYGLKSVTIGNSVTSIGDYAFYDCDGLTSVTIPNSVTSIGDAAFFNCEGLTSVTIGNSVTSIGDYAFSWCFLLKSAIFLGDAPRYVEDDIFDHCADDFTIKVKKGTKGWDGDYTSTALPTTWHGYQIAYDSSSTNDNFADAYTLTGASGSVNGSSDEATLESGEPAPSCQDNYGASVWWKWTAPATGTVVFDTIDSDFDTILAVYTGSSLSSLSEVSSDDDNGDGYTSRCEFDVVSGTTYYIAVYGYSNKKGDIYLNWEFIEWKYRVVNGEAEIYGGVQTSAIPETTTGAITVPSSLDGYPVTSIGERAFRNCSGLTSVTIPDSVTNIGDYAFYWCSDLTSITIPDSVTSIGGSAFKGCSGLTSFIVDSNNPSYKSVNGLLLTKDGKTLIAGVKGNIVIPDGVTSIGGSAFSYCYGLTSVTIPNSVTSIESSAFDGCSGLTSITIPDSVTSIGNFAFNCCSGLTSFIVDSNNPSYKSVNGLLLTKDGKTLIAGVNGDVVIPQGVTSIGDEAFYGCSGLTSITIPDSVTSIGSGVFDGCSGLTSVTIPDSVTSIGWYAFSGCSGLTSITIPDSVTSIDDSTFEGCKGLTSITIPDGVISIDNSAFEGCKGLTSITIPDSVASIGDMAFYGCSGLTSVTIGDSVSSIGGGAFCECPYLKSAIFLGDAPLGYVGDDIFNHCANDFTIKVKKGTKGWNGDYTSTELPETWYGYPIEYATEDEVLGIMTELVDGMEWKYRVVNGEAEIYGGDWIPAIPETITGAITIPSSLGGYPVTSIGDSAFYDCSSLTSVTIPNSVTSIGNEAFYDCDDLTSVTIPDSVTSIGDEAFDGCSDYLYDTTTIPGVKLVDGWVVGDTYECPSVLDLTGVRGICGCAFSWCRRLTSVTIPNSVTSIGDYAFYECSGLTSITIPDSVTSIGDYAFSWCRRLTSVTIPNSVTSIGDSAFYDCSSLTSVTIGDSVTNIGGSAFEGCSGLTSITIPDSVTSIGDRAFFYCSGLTSFIVDSNNPNFKSVNGLLLSKDGKTLIAGVKGNVVIPDGVTSIGSYAFYSCSGLTSITIPDSVTSIGNGAFQWCSGLTSVTIPNSVTSIGDSAFYDCSSLTSVTIGDSVTNIGGRAFEGCSGLTKFKVDSNNPNYKSVNGLLLSKDGKTLIAGINGDVVILDGVTSIESYAFSEYLGLTSVTIPNSVTSIGDYAFSECWGLTSVTIGNSVTSIGEGAFFDCGGLTSVTIPNSVTNIGDYAFQWCWDLMSVTIGDSVTSIGDSAFDGCSGLTSVTIPDSVTSIGRWAFEYCDNLKSAIFLGDAPRYVGDGIFYDSADDFVIKVKKGTKGWNGDYTSTALPTTWHGYPIEYIIEDDLYPVLDANATAGDVANALSGSVDEKLAENITSVEMYNSYREWALSVKNASGDEVAGVEAVMTSTTAWMSFALDQSRLIANEPVEGDVSIASLDVVAADGSFEFTVNINQIDVGDGAVEENLKKLFKIEGATTLGNDANFSSENVEIVLAEPVNGDVKFKILPKDSPDSFFIRAKLLK